MDRICPIELGIEFFEGLTGVEGLDVAHARGVGDVGHGIVEGAEQEGRRGREDPVLRGGGGGQVAEGVAHEEEGDEEGEHREAE